MENLELYNKVREVPQDAKKTISAGRIKGFTDINPMWRIKCLTEQFGPCGIGWYYKTVEKWTETVGDETCAFVMIELYVLYDGKWSQPISGTGGSRLATNERSGVYVSDECYKMATTDALHSGPIKRQASNYRLVERDRCIISCLQESWYWSRRLLERRKDKV